MSLNFTLGKEYKHGISFEVEQARKTWHFNQRNSVHNYEHN